jgi:hypothetical protein
MSALDLLLMSLTILVPGLGAALAAYRPGEVGIPTRLALVFALGFALDGFLALALVVVHALHPVLYFALLSGATVALWVVAFRRAPPVEHVRAWAAEFREDPWSLGAGLLVVVAMALVALTFSPLLNVSPSSSWRYWADAREIADAGRIPTASLQYGMLLPPTVSKAFLNSFNAAVGSSVGLRALPAMGALTWIGAVGMAAALWALGWELGLRRTAPLVPLLLVMNRLFLYREPSADLHTFKAETFGRLVIFTAVAVGARALREREGWVSAVLAGVLLGAAAGTHLVPTVVGAALFGWYVLARLLMARVRPRRSEGAQEPLTDPLRGPLLGPAAMLKRVGAMAGVGLLLAGAVLVLPRGDIGFQGSAGDAQYAQFGPDFDPTLYFSSGVLEQHPHLYSGSWYIAPSNVYQADVVRATGLQPNSPRNRQVLRFLEILLAVGGLLIALAMLRWFPEEVAGVGLAAWGLGASLVAGALYFSYRYDHFTLAWFGVRRLYDYSPMPLVLMGLGLLEGGLLLLRRLERRSKWRVPGDGGLPAVAGALLVVLATAVLAPTARVPSANVPRSDARAATLNWVREHTPCGARLLVNERTTGIFEIGTGRVALLEGMAPYLRPQILAEIVRLMTDARAFFADPAGHLDFLRSNRVDFVLLVKGSPLGVRGLLGRSSHEALLGVDGLDPIFSSAGLDVYRVSVPGAPAPSNIPVSAPGYHCQQGPFVGGGG